MAKFAVYQMWHTTAMMWEFWTCLLMARTNSQCWLCVHVQNVTQPLSTMHMCCYEKIANVQHAANADWLCSVQFVCHTFFVSCHEMHFWMSDDDEPLLAELWTHQLLFVRMVSMWHDVLHSNSIKLLRKGREAQLLQVNYYTSQAKRKKSEIWSCDLLLHSPGCSQLLSIVPWVWIMDGSWIIQSGLG